MNSLEKIVPHGTYAQVLEQLEARILNGEFPENTMLPPEEALARQLGVGRRVLREALRSLEIKGLVETRHGVGTLVCRNDLNRFLNALRQNVYAYLQLNRADAEQVREMRALFESAAIKRIAERPDTERLTALTENLQLQRQAADTGDAALYERHHLVFHRQIVSALDNPLIDMLYGQVLELMHPVMEASANQPGTMQPVIEEHEALLRALQSRKVAHAQRLLQAHLQGFSQHIAEVVESTSSDSREHQGTSKGGKAK